MFAIKATTKRRRTISILLLYKIKVLFLIILSSFFIYFLFYFTEIKKKRKLWILTQCIFMLGFPRFCPAVSIKKTPRAKEKTKLVILLFK